MILISRKVDKQMTDWKTTTTSRISVSKFDFQHPNHCRTLHRHILGPPMIELTPARCEDGVARDRRRRFDVAVLVIVAEPIVAPTHDVGDDDGGTPADVVTAHIVVSLINASSVMVVVVMMTVWKIRELFHLMAVFTNINQTDPSFPRLCGCSKQRQHRACS